MARRNLKAALLMGTIVVAAQAATAQDVTLDNLKWNRTLRGCPICY